MVIRSKQRLNVFKPYNIVLVEPEIPPNTGNIARLCSATNTKLHLVHPLGFKIDDTKLKRAGLDYWHLLDVEEYENWERFCLNNYKQNNVILSDSEEFPNDMQSLVANPSQGDTKPHFWYISTRGEKNIWDVEFNPGDYFIFGSETRGLSEAIVEDKKNKDSVISIPMNGKTRSLNLSTSVGIVLYEALRQATVEKRLFEIIPI